LPGHYSDGCRLHETEKMFGVIFPSTEESTLPLNPGKETHHQSASFAATQSTAVLRPGLNPSTPMWSDYLNAFLAQVFNRFVVIAGTRLRNIANVQR
jgi:hypothetical protein